MRVKQKRAEEAKRAQERAAKRGLDEAEFAEAGDESGPIDLTSEGIDSISRAIGSIRRRHRRFIAHVMTDRVARRPVRVSARPRRRWTRACVVNSARTPRRTPLGTFPEEFQGSTRPRRTAK